MLPCWPRIGSGALRRHWVAGWCQKRQSLQCMIVFLVQALTPLMRRPAAKFRAQIHPIHCGDQELQSAGLLLFAKHPNGGERKQKIEIGRQGKRKCKERNRRNFELTDITRIACASIMPTPVAYSGARGRTALIWPYSGLLRVIFLPDGRVRLCGQGESAVESEKRPQSRQNNAQCVLKRFNQEEVG